MASITPKFARALVFLIPLATATSAALVWAQSDRTNTPSEDSEEAGRPPTGTEDPPPPSAGLLLAERERELDAREAELEEAAKDLEAMRDALEKRIAQLESLLEEKKRVEKGIQTAQEQEEKARIVRLTEVAAKMPPERAALYLSELDAPTAAKILEGMSARKAAAILSEMVPSKAAEVSRIYLKSGTRTRTTKPTRAPEP